MGELIYVYRTTNTNYDDIFTNGICFFDAEYALNSSFEKVYNLYDYLHTLDSDEAAYIIRIPDSYFEVHNIGTKKILPYPMLFEKLTYDPKTMEGDFFPILIPCLIQMMYSDKDGCIENKNYNINYDPCGLKFTKEQLLSIRKNIEKSYDKFSKRNLGDSKKEYNVDKASGLWNDVLAYYKIENPVDPFKDKGNLGSINLKQEKVKKKTKKNKQKPRRED